MVSWLLRQILGSKRPVKLFTGDVSEKLVHRVAAKTTSAIGIQDRDHNTVTSGVTQLTVAFPHPRQLHLLPFRTVRWPDIQFHRLQRRRLFKEVMCQNIYVYILCPGLQKGQGAGRAAICPLLPLVGIRFRGRGRENVAWAAGKIAPDS